MHIDQIWSAILTKYSNKNSTESSSIFSHRGSFENALSWHLYWEVKMYLSGGDVKRSKSQFRINWISNFLKQSSWNINSTSKTRSFQNQTISSLCPQKKNFNVPKKRCRESVLFECPIFVCLSLRLTWAEYRVVATRQPVASGVYQPVRYFCLSLFLSFWSLF